MSVRYTEKFLAYTSSNNKGGKYRIEFTKTKLNEFFIYRDGEIYWNIKPCVAVSIGDKICPNPRKGIRYKQVCVHGYMYLVHRVIWVMFNDSIPKGYVIDHIDHDAFNNKIENLRLATNLQNKGNTRLLKSNTTGYKGVQLSWGKYWRAVIGINGKLKHLGMFKTAELAKEAYDKAAKEHYGDEFANLG